MGFDVLIWDLPNALSRCVEPPSEVAPLSAFVPQAEDLFCVAFPLRHETLSDGFCCWDGFCCLWDGFCCLWDGFCCLWLWDGFCCGGCGQPPGAGTTHVHALAPSAAGSGAREDEAGSTCVHEMQVCSDLR